MFVPRSVSRSSRGTKRELTRTLVKLKTAQSETSTLSQNSSSCSETSKETTSGASILRETMSRAQTLGETTSGAPIPTNNISVKIQSASPENRMESKVAAIHSNPCINNADPNEHTTSATDVSMIPVPGGADEEDDDPIVCYSKHQRWPEPEEPVCAVCGRYGEYIVDQTDYDICSLECKAKHLHMLGLPLTTLEEVGKNKTEASEMVKNKSKDKGDRIEISEEICVSESDVWSYREHCSVAAMSDDQVKALRDQYSIKVRGGEAPKPVTEFSHLSLPSQVLINLNSAGYLSPTPVQIQTVPAALARRDLLVCATTGSGKTLSFLLPLVLNLLSSTTPEERAESPRALVLAPTRELAMQIETQAKEIMKGVPVMRTALIVGGVPLAQQLHRLRSGIQVVIATPARLNDIIMHHTSEIELMDIEILVVDEVDCLLQMGFENQFLEIEELLPKRRQNLMFSATIPRKIERMATRLMQDPLFISIGEVRKTRASLLYSEKLHDTMSTCHQPSVPCDSIKHTVIWVEENSKRKKLFALLDDCRHFRPPAVVFVSSKMGALLLANAINKTRTHLSAVGIHGDMAQERRSEIVKGCVEGKFSLVVATNVLGRGLDLFTVRQVIIFDMPSSITEFIHQIGRAGRLGSPGTAYTFINNNNKTVFMDLATLLEAQGTQLPSQLTNSPHLRAQLDKRKRHIEGEVVVRGKKPKTAGAGSLQDQAYHHKESLLQMIKTSTKKSTFK